MSHILRMPGVPDHSRALLQQLLAEDLIPVEALPHIVESYRRVIHEARKKNPRTNVVMGDMIANSLVALLKKVTPKTGEQNLRIIQAAVRYFVIQNDGVTHDLETEAGFDDDARVVNAVLRFFGRDDLMIDVPERRMPATRPSPAVEPARRAR
ncbi:MAG: hypothetical protein KC635_02880 [Myxococcales bacterium]|nr:hypothetical protein [Myxococcales bacterium]MCB9733756.1 hypothetical protein [Deltaproteobacteria bacterium]